MGVYVITICISLIILLLYDRHKLMAKIEDRNITIGLKSEENNILNEKVKDMSNRLYSAATELASLKYNTAHEKYMSDIKASSYSFLQTTYGRLLETCRKISKKLVAANEINMKYHEMTGFNLGGMNKDTDECHVEFSDGTSFSIMTEDAQKHFIDSYKNPVFEEFFIYENYPGVTFTRTVKRKDIKSIQYYRLNRE